MRPAIIRFAALTETVSKIAFVSSGSDDAEQAAAQLKRRYGDCAMEAADCVVVLGGDGLMLETLHKLMNSSTPAYGMNFGSVGFLMNEFVETDLVTRISTAVPTQIHPLAMQARDNAGGIHDALALNEVSLFRSSYQAAKIQILVDGESRMDELTCDGILLATPAGSTAYNLSAYGPILPIDSPLLALTPISAFRPRRWRGAILPNRAMVTFRMHEVEKRPVSAVADNVQFQDVVEVTVREDRSQSAQLLFDSGHGLEERVLNEQFRY